MQILEGKPVLQASSDMAAASDRAEVDTARPFRSVKEAVAVFGGRLVVRETRSKPITIAKHVASTTPSLNPMLLPTPRTIPMPVSGPTPATMAMPSAPSSPPSSASSPSPDKGDNEQDEAEEVELMIMNSIKKMEAEIAETKQEVVQLKKRLSEMDLSVATLNAQLHRGLSKLAKMEAEKAAAERGTIQAKTNTAMAVWSGRRDTKSGELEYLPSLGHALSLGEIDEEFIGKRRRVQKQKPIVPLIGDILFSKKKKRLEDKADSFYPEDLYSVLR